MLIIGGIAASSFLFDWQATAESLENQLPSHSTFPETGIWFNPQQSGTGFMFEVQNGWLGGFYYLYDDAGQPVWYLIAGALEASEEEGITWMLEANLERLEAGTCLNCSFQQPVVVEPAGQIRLEFLHRNLGRFSVDNGPVQIIVPLTYGVTGHQPFHPDSDHVLPDLEGEWVFVISGRNADGDSIRERRALRLLRTEMDNGVDDGVHYEVQWLPRRLDPALFPPGQPPPLEAGLMECFVDDELGPVCRIEIFSGSMGGIYTTPVENVGDARFAVERPNGLSLHAFRLGHD